MDISQILNIHSVIAVQICGKAVKEMTNKEEMVLINILDKIERFTNGSTTYENCMKSAQIVKDMSEAYLNIIKASDMRGKKND